MVSTNTGIHILSRCILIEKTGKKNTPRFLLCLLSTKKNLFQGLKNSRSFTPKDKKFLWPTFMRGISKFDSSFLYQETSTQTGQNTLMIIKKRLHPEKLSNKTQVEELMTTSDLVMEPHTIEILKLEPCPTDPLNRTYLSFFVCFSTQSSINRRKGKNWLELFWLKKAELLVSLIPSFPLISHEIRLLQNSKRNPELSLLSPKSQNEGSNSLSLPFARACPINLKKGLEKGELLNRTLATLIIEEIDQENDRLKDIEGLNLDDRKSKYSQEQLIAFVDFKDSIIHKMGAEKTNGLDDNIYCRFLDGYLFNIPECTKNITGFLVSFFKLSELASRN